LDIYQDVVCPVCGCLCDDIEVNVENNRVSKVKNACAMGTTKFLNYNSDRLHSPLMRTNGSQQPSSLEESITRVAEMLVNAKYPVVYGLALSSCEAVKVAVELVEEIGGVIDNQTTVCHGPSVQGFHEVGESTASLGEVRHRADLVVCWGCNPVESHPRHFERYSYTVKGRFRKGKEDRKLIVVDVRNTGTAKIADKFIQLEPNKDYELVNALRTALNHEQIQCETVAGIPVEEIESLAETLRTCEFGALFYGLGASHTAGKGRNIESLGLLVRDLNNWTKFVLMPARGHYNVTGVNQVCAWQTGFPYAVDFSRGYPWYNPGETTFVDILRRKESDASLIIGSDPVAHFPIGVSKYLCSKPLAVIDPSNSMTTMAADIVIPSSFAGIESEGIAYRMDGVTFSMKKVVEPPEKILSDEDVLKLILGKVKALKRLK